MCPACMASSGKQPHALGHPPMAAAPPPSAVAVWCRKEEEEEKKLSVERNMKLETRTSRTPRLSAGMAAAAAGEAFYRAVHDALTTLTLNSKCSIWWVPVGGARRAGGAWLPGSLSGKAKGWKWREVLREGMRRVAALGGVARAVRANRPPDVSCGRCRACCCCSRVVPAGAAAAGRMHAWRGRGRARAAGPGGHGGGCRAAATRVRPVQTPICRTG